MTVSNDLDVSQRPSWWSDLRRQYFQKRYVLSWILAVLLPFILLRLLFMSEITFPFQWSGNSPISLEPKENQEQTPINSASSPAAIPDVKPKTTPESPLVRPDEDAWITHDNWTHHHLNPRVEERMKDHRSVPGENENSTEVMKSFTAMTKNGENFGLPEDNEKEELALEATENQSEASAGNAQLGKSEEEKNKDKQEKQTAGNKNAEGQGRIDEQREDEEKLSNEDMAARDREAEAKMKVEGEQQEPEAMKPIEEEHQPEDQVDKEEDKVLQDSGRQHDETLPGECDLFEGEWEHDPEGPLYTNSSCFYIQQRQNCMSNGRPDIDYMYWKWKPRGCDLPRFDAKSFLDSFRGKAIGFVGDSIARNQMQSLLCLLSQVEIPVMTYETPDDQTVRWLFKEHQITLGVVWSPYLLKDEDGVMGFEKGQSVLYLDVLDTAWTSVMQDFDVMVFLTGQWYYKRSVYIKQERVVGCHYCPGLNLTEVEFYEAYRAGIRQVLERVSNEFKGVAIMSTFPLSHFENGTWDTGGYCKREQPLQPLQSAQFPGDHNQFREIVMKEFNDVVRDNREQNKDAHLEILDVTKVSLQRADGHPGRFRYTSAEKEKDPNMNYPNDCLHWCLPGPIEAWNQLVVKILEKYF